MWARRQQQGGCHPQVPTCGVHSSQQEPRALEDHVQEQRELLGPCQARGGLSVMAGKARHRRFSWLRCRLPGTG